MSIPLSTLLSQALVAHTIELDNEFERRFAEAGGGARVTSFVMWSNLLRFVGDGITVGELVAATGLQKPRVLSALGGVERWRYVTIRDRREGYGSARGLKDDLVVRLTPVGQRAAAIWAELGDAIAARWRERFGAARVDELEALLHDVVDPVAVELPEYVPVLLGSSGMALDLPRRERAREQRDPALVVLLARGVMRYALDFERESPLSLALSANVVCVLDETGVGVAELPVRTGISKEAAAMALTALRRTEYVVVDGPTPTKAVARLTPAGAALRTRLDGLHEEIEELWTAELGVDVVRRLRASLEGVLGDAALSDGLRPPEGGWRAGTAYRARTDALVADPRAALPHAPMVLHRGGWPDGS